MSFIELVAQRRSLSPPAGMQPPENAADWFRIENAAEDADETDVYVYGSIGGFWGIYADEFIDQLKQVTTKRVNLRINSGGGSVFEGVAVANAIRSHPANFTVYVDSLAASIASVIMLAGDKVVFMPQAQAMIHNAAGACFGDASEMTKMADLLDRQNRIIADAYAQRTGRPVAEFLDMMAAETWFTGQEALDLGLADELYMPPKKEEEEECEPMHASASCLMNRVWDLSAYRYAGRENAPDPMAARDTTGPDTSEERPVQGSSQGFEAFAQYTQQLADLVRAAVHDEFSEVFGSVSPSHSTSVQEGTWDAGANEKRLPSPVPLATVKKMYTYWDADQAEDGKVPKSACKLPHHFVSEDGTPGAASVSGVRNALARLPQTQGLSDAERSAAEAHLRKHLNAFSGGEEDHADTGVSAEETADAGTGEEQPVIPDGADAPGEETGALEETPPDEADTTTEPRDEADDWKQTVGFFASLTTSPSADDVFAKLKEAW